MKTLCRFFEITTMWLPLRLSLCVCLCLSASPTQAQALTQHTVTRGDNVHHDNTANQLLLTAVGIPANETEQLADAVWREVARLEKILGEIPHDQEQKNHSESAQLTRPQSHQLQTDTHQNLLQLCESWRVKTDNAISCRLGSVHKLWQQAAQSGELPERTVLRKTARRLAALEQPLTNNNVDIPELQWQLGQLAVGYLLDAALAKARAVAPTAQGIKLELNGNALYWGVNAEQQAWSVAVTQTLAAGTVTHGVLTLAATQPASTSFSSISSAPTLSASISSAPISSVLKPRAFAYSDTQNWHIGTRQFSRTLNPKDGWPVMFAPSVAVVAADATTAAVLAQALRVMPIRAGLALVNTMPETEVLIMTETAKTFASSGWYSLLIPDQLHQPLWERDMQFLVEYQIPALSVAEYRRPYVAVWITNTAKQPVRQLLVHGDSLRWLREIPLWWRRAGRHDESMLDGLTSATPKPGQHMLVWDGRDDAGHRVEQGDYILHIEAAREHGERELITVPFTLSSQPFAHQQQGVKELGRIKVSFKPTP